MNEVMTETKAFNASPSIGEELEKRTQEISEHFQSLGRRSEPPVLPLITGASGLDRTLSIASQPARITAEELATQHRGPTSLMPGTE